MVEQRHPIERLLHEPPLVDDGEYLLRPLVLVTVDHEVVSPRRGLPVDGAVVIALHIVPHLLELGELFPLQPSSQG